MRIFIALPVGEAACTALSDAQQALATLGLPVRWVRPEGIHLTLAFLGEIPETRLPDASAAMDAATPPTETRPLALHLAALGAFPDRGAPRVLWGGLGGDLAQLAGLQARLTNALRVAGFELERQVFRPHLTLGRATGRWTTAHLDAWNQHRQRHLLPPAPWTAEHLDLIQSVPGPGGSRYTVLREHSLSRSS